MSYYLNVHLHLEGQRVKINYAEDACNSPNFVFKNAFLVKNQVKSTSEDMLQEKVISSLNSARRNLRVVTHFETTLVKFRRI